MTKYEFTGIEPKMTADEAIGILVPRGLKAVRSGWTERTDKGLIGKWVFDDGTVITLARDIFPGPYLIQSIEHRQYTPEEVNNLDLKTMLPQAEEMEPIETMEVKVTEVTKKRKRRKQGASGE